MPVYWAPWPVNRKATFGGGVDARAPASAGCVAPARRAASAAASSADVPPRTASRCGSCARPVFALKQRSAVAPGSASRSRQANASAFSASSSWAASASRCSGRSSESGAVVCGTASSRITCAFVPEKPNELMPMRAGAPRCGQSSSVVGTRSGMAAQSTSGLGFLKCRCGGTCLCCSAVMAFNSPTIPAAASRWPKLVLHEPTSNGRPASRPAPSAAASACSSIGSPSEVPVPCASTRSMSAGASFACASAARITASCAGPFGAVRPLLRPSWFIAEPRISASERALPACASRWRCSTSTAAPSPRP